MYQTPSEMRKAIVGVDTLTQEQRRKMYELVYDINETLREFDDRGRTIAERDYTRMEVRAAAGSDVEIDVYLEDGDVMHFQSSIFF